MRYVEARIEENSREEAYRIFVTKSLQLIPQKKYIAKDFKDVFKPEKVDNRTAGEITADIITKAGLNFG